MNCSLIETRQVSMTCCLLFLQEPPEAFLQALKNEDILKHLAGYHPTWMKG